MWQNIVITFSIVFPFMVFMGLGALLRRFGFMDTDFARKLNRILTNVLLPIYVFNSLYSKDLSHTFEDVAALYTGLSILPITLILVFFYRKIEKDPAKQGALVHATYRSNAMLFALPIAQGIYGSDIPEAAVILAVVALINNLVAVPLMEYYEKKVLGQEESRKKRGLGYMILDFFRTPLFDGVLLGILWSILRLPLPGPVASVTSGLAGASVPFAFIVLGASIDLSHLKENRKLVVLAVAIKLFIMPALFMIYPLLAGWQEKSLVTVIIGYAAPTAVTAFPISESYHCDGKLAGEVVSLSAALSIITYFLWIFGMRQSGLIH